MKAGRQQPPVGSSCEQPEPSRGRTAPVAPAAYGHLPRYNSDMGSEVQTAYQPSEGDRVRGVFSGVGRVTSAGRDTCLIDTEAVKGYVAQTATLRPAWSGVGAVVRDVYMEYYQDRDDGGVDAIGGPLFEAIGSFIGGGGDADDEHARDLDALSEILSLAAAVYHARSDGHS